MCLSPMTPAHSKDNESGLVRVGCFHQDRSASRCSGLMLQRITETRMRFPCKRLFLAGAAAAALALALPAQAAEEYPSRPIMMLVPLQAGTLADLVARSLGEELAATLKQ